MTENVVEEEKLTNVSLINILASAVLLNENHLEIPIDLAVDDFSSKNLSLSYDEDRRMLVLQLVNLEVAEDESGSTSEEPA